MAQLLNSRSDYKMLSKGSKGQLRILLSAAALQLTRVGRVIRAELPEADAPGSSRSHPSSFEVVLPRSLERCSSSAPVPFCIGMLLILVHVESSRLETIISYFSERKPYVFESSSFCARVFTWRRFPSAQNCSVSGRNLPYCASMDTSYLSS